MAHSSWLKARWIVPITSPPIHHGWIEIANRTIVDFGDGIPPAGNQSDRVQDRGDVAILPCLVNAHTHLEFSDCDVPIGQPGVELADWIGQVVATRSRTSQPARSDAIKKGLKESLESGVSLIGEITTPPIDQPISLSGSEVVSFAEVLGLSEQRWTERYASALKHQTTMPHPGISPHAPYSTSQVAINRCVRWSSQFRQPLAMHVAESPAERELLTAGTGPFADALSRLGVSHDDCFPWGGNPIHDLIVQLAGSSRGLLIHGNDLREAEIATLAENSNLSVVYCPRTHHFFRHRRHPVAELLSAGVNVALGTDSRASNPDLNLWREVQFLLQRRQDIAPHEVLTMATIGGANALGMEQQGCIRCGAKADLIEVITTATDQTELFRDMAEQLAARVPDRKSPA